MKFAGLLVRLGSTPRQNNHSFSRHAPTIYIPAWIHGQPAALDLAITSPQRQEVVSEAANTEEECGQQGILFVPLVAESSGGWGASAFSVFKRMAKQTCRAQGGLIFARSGCSSSLPRAPVRLHSLRQSEGGAPASWSWFRPSQLRRGNGRSRHLFELVSRFSVGT